MAFRRIRNGILAAAVVIGAVACGGGVQLAGGGIGGTGVSQGPITGFGSIFVNGVEFNTTGATVIKDGSPATQADLQIGMVVTVDGNIASSTAGTAATVTYRKDLEGPIAATGNNTLTVLGQTVIVDNLTKVVIPGIPTATFNDLHMNDTVEVSGLLNSTGLRATYIEKKPSNAGGTVEVKGAITAKSGTTLSLGALTVDIGNIAPSFTPNVGDFVEIKGTLVAGTGTLAATSIQLESRTLGTASKEKAELQGYVTAVGAAAGDFTLDAQPVHTDAQTVFVGGLATDIKTGMRLEVEGSLVSGTLNATRVKFEDNLALQGNIASIDPAQGKLTLDSFPTIDIAFNSVLTEAEGGADLTTLNLAVGNRVTIRGRTLSGTCGNTTCMLATKLTLETSASAEAKLQGTVEAVADPFITLLGVPIDTSVITTFDGSGVTNRTEFFAAVKVGSTVEVKGVRDAAGIVTWQSIDIED